MRSLIFAASALSVALCPAAPLRAEQPLPVVSTPVTLVAPATPTAENAASSPELTTLTVLDRDGTRRTLLCRPLSEEKAAPPPSAPRAAVSSPRPGARPAPQAASPTPAPHAAARAALPASPAPAPAVQVVTRPAPNPCPAPPRPTDLNIVPGAPLYADPAAVAAAWNCYAPRQMAYAPRAWRAPDPAVHSPLPPMRRVSRPAAAVRAQKSVTEVSMEVMLSAVAAAVRPPAADGPAASPAAAAPSPSALPAPRASGSGLYGGAAPVTGLPVPR